MEDHNYFRKENIEDYIDDKKFFEGLDNTHIELLSKSLTSEPIKLKSNDLNAAPGHFEFSIESQNNEVLLNNLLTDSNKLSKIGIRKKTLKKRVIKKKSTKNMQQDIFCKFCVFDHDLMAKELKISYLTNEELEEHIRKDHDSELPYTCLQCKKNFKKSKLCRRHILYGHVKPKITCEVCGAQCTTTKISQHILRYHTIDNYTCEICKKEFKNTSLVNFNYHKRWHNKTKQYKCDMCDKVFVQLGHLKVHKMEKHTKDFDIKCAKCGQGFSSQYKKSVHMTKIHGDLKPLKCKFCDQRFNTYMRRSRHMNALHDYYGEVKNEEVKCESCYKMFKNDTGLKSHLFFGCKGHLDPKENSDKTFCCSICPRKFKNIPALTKHSKLHSKEGRPYPCDRCYLNFRTKLELVCHKCYQLGRLLENFQNQ